MNTRHGSRALLKLLVIVAALLSAVCGSERTADEIVSKSRTHFEAMISFETNTIHYFNPNVDEPSTSDRMRIALPSSFLFLDPDGTIRIISIENTVYRRAESEEGKWTRSANENVTGGNTNQRNLLIGIFPATFFEADLVESDNDFFVVEGFGSVYNNLGEVANRARWHQLRIRKSDFALVELTKWDFPTVLLDDDGNVTQRIPEEGEDTDPFPVAHLRTVTEISEHDVDFSIEAPPEVDIVIELLRTWPKEMATDVSPRDQVGFYLSEATAIMELSVNPAIQLVPSELDHPVMNEFPGVKIFKPDRIWERDTTYTATLRWG